MQLFNTIKAFKNDSFLNKVSLLSVGSIFKFIVQLLVVIYFSRKLSLEDYAAYQLVWMYINFFSVVAIFGLSQLLLSTTTNSILIIIKKNKTSIFLFFISTNLLALFYLIFYNNYFNSIDKWLIFIFLFIQNCSLITESIAIKNNEIKRLFFANLLYVILFFGIHLYAYLHNYSLTTIIIGLMCSTALKAFLLFSIKQNKIDVSIDSENIGWQWFYLGINDLLAVSVKWIDKWLILLFLPAAQFAIYFNGTYEIPIFLLLLSAVGAIGLAEMGTIQKNNFTEIKKLFYKSSLLLAAIIIPSFIFLLFNSQLIITYLFGEKYSASIPIFKVTLFILPVRIVYSTLILQSFNKNQLIVKGAVLDFLCALIFIVCLYPFFKLQGLAAAFVLSTYIQVGYYLWQTSRLLHQKIKDFLPLKKLLVYLLTSIAINVLAYFVLKNVSSLINLAIHFIICLVTIAVFFVQKNKHIQNQF